MTTAWLVELLTVRWSGDALQSASKWAPLTSSSSGAVAAHTDEREAFAALFPPSSLVISARTGQNGFIHHGSIPGVTERVIDVAA